LLGVSLPVVPPVLPVVPPVLPVLPLPVVPPVLPVLPLPVLPLPVAPEPVLPLPVVPGLVLPEPLPVAVDEPPVGLELCPERSPLHDTASSDNDDKAMRLMERKLRMTSSQVCLSLDHRGGQPPCRR
jgi:hypothetical protein